VAQSDEGRFSRVRQVKRMWSTEVGGSREGAGIVRGPGGPTG